MATAAENMATAMENLALQAAQVTARLVELDAMPADVAASTTFTVGAQTYDWNGYRSSLQATLDGLGKRVEDLAKAAQIIGGPFTVVGALQDGCYG